MKRPDLPPGFDGWQIVDGTPQEWSPEGGGYIGLALPLSRLSKMEIQLSMTPILLLLR